MPLLYKEFESSRERILFNSEKTNEVLAKHKPLIQKAIAEAYLELKETFSGDELEDGAYQIDQFILNDCISFDAGESFDKEPYEKLVKRYKAAQNK